MKKYVIISPKYPMLGKEVWLEPLQLQPQQPKSTGPKTIVVISNGYTAQCSRTSKGYKAQGRDVPDISMFNSEIEIWACYYQRQCVGLERATEEMKKLLEKLVAGKERVVLIGHSKSAQGQVILGEELRKNHPELDVIVVTVSPTFGGTALASKEEFYKHAKNVGIPKMLLVLLGIIWKIAFQDIPVERDVAKNSYYTLKYIKFHRNVTVNFVTKVESCQNAQDIGGLINIFLNWALRYDECGGGDGIVDVSSQTLGVDPRKNIFLNGPHCHGVALACQELVKRIYPELG